MHFIILKNFEMNSVGYQKTIKSAAEDMSKEIDEIIMNDLLKQFK